MGNACDNIGADILIKDKKMKRKNGFTIIEVVLVLAIAGLIFLMVFIALPALQRSQRDTQRKDDIARAQTALNSFMSNNRGRVPDRNGWGSCVAGSATGFCERYLLVGGDVFEDPDGTSYEFVATRQDETPQAQPGTGGVGGEALSWSNTDDRHKIFVYGHATWDGEEAVRASGARNIAFRYALEGGSVICVNN